MKPSRCKTMTIAVVLLGVAGLAIGALVFHARLVEQWHLWRLEAEEWTGQKAAAQKLAEMGSMRAVPYLLEALNFEERRGLYSVGSHLFLGLSQYQEFMALAVLRIARKNGRATVPRLIRGLQHPKPVVRVIAAFVLGELGREAAEAGPTLEALIARDEDAGVRVEGAAALKKIRGEEVPGE